MLQVFTLFSGSSGNAVLVKYGADAILIDAGGSARRVTAALASLGVSPDAVRAIFVTHGHSDHTAALAVFCKKHPVSIYLTNGAAKYLPDAVRPLVQERVPCFREVVGKMQVQSFSTPHDSDMSVGYVITTPDGKVGVVTDLGYVSPEVAAAVAGCDAVVLEANHDEDMLRYGPYPTPLKRRIFSTLGHLSNSQSAAFARALADGGTRKFLLAHLSEENNTPALAVQAVEDALCGTGATCMVAARFTPTCLIGGESVC